VEGNQVNECRFRPQRLLPVALFFTLACAGCSSAKPDPVCDQFMQLKNARDPAAAELLGPLPPVPADPVTEEEADRLDAEFVLHSPLQVVEVRADTSASADGKAAHCVLVVKGTFTCRPLRVVGAHGLSQRYLVNPDLIVEVRDGKIYGLRAQLHTD
jgi:hypothetical protein